MEACQAAAYRAVASSLDLVARASSRTTEVGTFLVLAAILVAVRASFEEAILVAASSAVVACIAVAEPATASC